MKQILGLTFLALLWAVHVAPIDASAAEPLTIAVSKTPLSLPVYIAQDEGFFKAEGIQVRLEEVIGGNRAMQDLQRGKADLATVSEAVVMFNSFSHDNFVVLASFVKSDDDVKLVTRRQSNIASASQLSGKRVGTILGAASHYYLDTMLLLQGVDPKLVQVVGLQPEVMEKALASGEVDAVAVWEPYPFAILQKVPEARVVTTPRFYHLSFNLAANRKLAGTRSDDMVKILRALARAQELIRADPAKAQALLRRHLGLNQAFIDWIWPRYYFHLSLDQSLLTTLEGEARWARNFGHVKAGSSPNYLRFIESGPLRAVNAALVTIVE